MPPFREIAVLPLQSQNRQPAYRARKRHSTARLRTDARPPRDGSEHFGPAREHTAKFEPAAWSWAQMTSGLGAPKRILSERCASCSSRPCAELRNGGGRDGWARGATRPSTSRGCAASTPTRARPSFCLLRNVNEVVLKPYAPQVLFK